MTEEADFDILDEKKIFTSVATNLIEKLLAFAEGKYRKNLARRKNKQIKLLEKYATEQYEWHSRVKNIVFGDDSVSIFSLYVAPRFNIGGKEVSEKKLFSDFKKKKRIIVTATAGAGKSFFMKNTFLSILRENQMVLPIFFDLRNLNDHSPKHLKSILLTTIKKSIPDFMEEQLIDGLNNGLFAFVFDGFDEIDPALTDHYERELLDFSEIYKNCSIIISSRPNDTTGAWLEFSVAKIQPLSKKEVILLIKKMPFGDEDTRKNFLNGIEKDLYRKHRDFLSIPLLASIMLLTF